MLDKKLRFIAFCGAQGSGKDYVAHYIANNIEKKAVVVKFATKLTEMTAALLGVDDLSLFQDREWKERTQFVHRGKLVSARQMQQFIGTMCREMLGANVWVNALAAGCNDSNTLYLISDLRYPNELDFVHKNNGIVVFVDNSHASRKQYQKENGVVHPSEKLMWSMHNGTVKPDYWLDNNDFNNPQPLQDLLHYVQ